MFECISSPQVAFHKKHDSSDTSQWDITSLQRAIVLSLSKKGNLSRFSSPIKHKSGTFGNWGPSPTKLASTSGNLFVFTDETEDSEPRSATTTLIYKTPTKISKTVSLIATNASSTTSASISSSNSSNSSNSYSSISSPLSTPNANGNGKRSFEDDEIFLLGTPVDDMQGSPNSYQSLTPLHGKRIKTSHPSPPTSASASKSTSNSTSSSPLSHSHLFFSFVR